MPIPYIDPTKGRLTARTDGRVALVYVDQAEALGVIVDFPEVDQARKLMDRAADIKAEANRLRQIDARTETKTAAAAYLAGDLDLDGVIATAARIDTSSTATTGGILAAAQQQLSAEAATTIATIGDRWITDAFRPAVDRLLAQLPTISDTLPDRHVDDLTDLRRHGRPAVDAWTHLTRLVDDLDALHDIADAMRMSGAIPVRQPRPAQDFRWGNRAALPERLDGSHGYRKTAFLTGYRNGAEPGIYTETEITADDKIAA